MKETTLLYYPKTIIRLFLSKPEFEIQSEDDALDGKGEKEGERGYFLFFIQPYIYSLTLYILTHLSTIQPLNKSS